MSQEVTCMELATRLAKNIYENGAVLIIAGLPVGTQLGIDLCTYTVAKNFRGIKMIPPGIHFIWCASQGNYGDVAPRVGFVHYFNQSEILVKEWDTDREELRGRNIDEAAAMLECTRIKKNLQNLDRYLAPYDYRLLGEWKQLTDKITDDTVKRCRPTLYTIRTNIELQSCCDADRPRGPLRLKIIDNGTVSEQELLPKLKPVEGTAPRFTTIPPRVPKDISPAEISRHNMDCVVAISKLFAQFSDYKSLIEEVQIAFIFYLVGYSIESLEHWCELLHLLSHSEDAINKYELFYMDYSEVLAYQIPHLPVELMQPTIHNTVYKDVRCLLTNFYLGNLSTSANRLIEKLTKTMKWDFEGIRDEDPEELPIIVESE